MNARCIASRAKLGLAVLARHNHTAFLSSIGLVILLLVATVLHAGVTASISGTVTDASGAAVQGAKVTATQVDTGVTSTLETNGQGFYSFQSLALGKYTITVEQKGFKSYQQTGLVLDVNQSLVVDVALQVGQESEKVEVLSSA